jgi:hypothetical protein
MVKIVQNSKNGQMHIKNVQKHTHAIIQKHYIHSSNTKRIWIKT